MRPDTIDQLNEVYSTLNKILNSRQVFDLEDVPQSLANSLQAMRRSLEQALKELQCEGSADNLEAELSQDADSPYSTIR
jgi:hypothetical protein